MTAAPFQLRPYQVSGIEGLRGEFRARRRRALLVMPTGAGKTATAAQMVGDSYRNGKRILWLADREELVNQASDAFDLAGTPHTYILPGEDPSRFAQAFVGTVQSFLARKRQQKWLPERVDIIFIDEAHRTESKSFQQVLEMYPDAYVVGLTATPIRGDGRGLGNTYQGMVQPVTIRELFEAGYLVRPRYFIPSELDFSAVQRKKGEYSAADMESIAESNPQLIGDVVETFARVCPDRRAVAFPMTIRHSIGLRDAFNAAGISAIHIDGTMRRGERQVLMRAFRAGEAQVLTSVNIAIEGLDVPDVSAVILARPTKSERIFIQAVGRGLRSSPGKMDCIVLDHGGCVLTLGAAEDYDTWELHRREGVEGTKAGQKKRDAKDITCEQCSAVFFSSRTCPECGHEHEFERSPKAIAVATGNLEELTGEGRRVLEVSQDDKKRWWAELQGWVLNQNKRSGAAFYLYRDKFGIGPGNWQKQVPAVMPSPEVTAWANSQDRKNYEAWKVQRLLEQKRAEAAD